MSQKQYFFVAFLTTALLLGEGLALAASPPLALHPEDLGPAPAQRLWVWNLGAEPADLIGGPSTAAKVQVQPGESLEVSELLQVKSPAELSAEAAVLLVAAPQDFDPSALVIDGEARVRQEKVGRRMRTSVQRPAWAASLLAMTADTARLSQGQSAEVLAEADPNGRVQLAAALEKGSAVKVIVKDEQGEVLKSFSLGTGAPVRLQIDLGSAEELLGARLALQVNRGRAVAGISRGAGGLRPILAKSVICSSGFSPTNIIYSGSYTYSVWGCPANTCGELDIKRNGNWEFTPNWICTDSSGNATKGPWNWSDKASDETGEPVFIRWPSGDTTDEQVVVVDKDCSRTYRDSADGAPPSSFYGHATDNTWGAGFDFGGFCICYFRDVTTGITTIPSATVTRIDRGNVFWSCTPPATVSGHRYQWSASCLDGHCGYDTPLLEFTKP